VSFVKESIPSLLAHLNNAKLDMWVRKEAYAWLKKVKAESVEGRMR
jgi:hypothetical protein